MTEDSPISNNEKAEPIRWLREVLTALLEVSPLSYWQKNKTTRFLKVMPDWLISKWAEALNINYINGFTKYPDMANDVSSDTGRQLAQQYLDSHDAVPIANVLGDLVKTAAKKASEFNLLMDSDMIERQICALALAGCNAEGAMFSEKAEGILSIKDKPNNPLVDYHLALASGEVSKIKTLDATLTGGRYGSWVVERLAEMKRYLGLEPPHFSIRTGERTPQWNLLWQKIFTGGDDN